MSRPVLLTAAAMTALAACAGQPMLAERDSRGELRLARELAGKVAGQPVDCLPNYRSNDMDVIDHDTILFRSGATVYLQNTRGSCYPDSGNSGGYTLVTRGVAGGNGLCDGDIAQTIDSSSGFFARSCAFNAFVPYRPATR